MVAIVLPVVTHADLIDLDAGDPHAQYAHLAGRDGGMALSGGTGADEALALVATTAAPPVGGCQARVVQSGLEFPCVDYDHEDLGVFVISNRTGASQGVGERRNTVFPWGYIGPDMTTQWMIESHYKTPDGDYWGEHYFSLTVPGLYEDNRPINCVWSKTQHWRRVMLSAEAVNFQDVEHHTHGQWFMTPGVGSALAFNGTYPGTLRFDYPAAGAAIVSHRLADNSSWFTLFSVNAGNMLAIGSRGIQCIAPIPRAGNVQNTLIYLQPTSVLGGDTAIGMNAGNAVTGSFFPLNVSLAATTGLWTSVLNTSSTSTAHAAIELSVLSAAGGDPFVRFGVVGGDSYYTFGIDNSADDDLLISGFVPGTDVKLRISKAGLVTVPLGLRLPVYSDGTRPAAGTAGRVIFNTDDGMPNFDNGTQWTLADGSTT